MRYYILLFLLCLLSFQNLLSAQDSIQYGKASFYADAFEGQRTASGEIFRQNKMTAAHTTLPFGTYVKVTHLNNKRSVVVRINDRGPLDKHGRIIDISRKAARELNMINSGIAQVKLEIIDIENIETIDKEITIDEAIHQNGCLFAVSDQSAVMNKKYSLLIASFTDYNELKQFLNNPAIQQLTIIQPFVIQKKEIYHLHIGYFANRRLAIHYRKQNNIQGVIKRHNNFIYNQ